MEIKWIVHKGKIILFVDYSGARDEEDMINLLRRHSEIEKGTPGLIGLYDFTDTIASVKYMNEAKKIGKEMGTKKAAKIALLGINGVKEILFGAFVAFTGDKHLRTFKKTAEALEWLAE